MRTTRSWVPALLAAICLGVTGCGAGANARAVGSTEVPVPAGAQVMTHVRSCDRGANAYCSEQLVIVGTQHQTSTALLTSEKQLLSDRGWTSTAGAYGNDRAADSPGHELRLYYAPAYLDLLAIDSNWIQRSPPIAHALSTTMFNRAPAISVMLERGSS